MEEHIVMDKPNLNKLVSPREAMIQNNNVLMILSEEIQQYNSTIELMNAARNYNNIINQFNTGDKDM